MKISGQEIKGPSEEVLVLPRLSGDIVFRARAVLDMTEFAVLCPLPKAPGRLTRDGFKSNTEDPSYRQQIDRHSNLRLAYLVIHSLEPSDIEWDTVNDEDPNSWLNWETDLSKSGFSAVEIQRVMVVVMQANSLDEGKLKEARDSFLLGQAQLKEVCSGQSTEQESTQPGRDANG